MGMFGFVLGLSAGVYFTKRAIMKNQQQKQTLNNVSEEEKQSMWQQYLNQKKMETNSQALLNHQQDTDDDNHSLLSLSREYITRIRNNNLPIIHAQEKTNIDSLNSELNKTSTTGKE